MHYQLIGGRARLSAFLVYPPEPCEKRPLSIFPLPHTSDSRKKRRCTHGALQAGQSVSHNTIDVFVVGKCT